MGNQHKWAIVVIVGTGIDITEHLRMQRELGKGSWDPDRDVFTAAEITDCQSARSASLQYATCFAAKEAVLKALGLAVGDLGFLREVEVRLGPNGRHSIALHGRTLGEANRLGVKHIWLSIASTKKHSSAMVVLEA